MNLRYLLQTYKGPVLLALAFGAATIVANLGLQSTSSYLIAKAAQHPSTILLLWIPIVGVRFFGTVRGVFRYGDRYFSHDVTLRWLRDLRVAVYKALEPRSSPELKGMHSGDLLMRVSADIDSLQNLFVGLWAPVIIGIAGTAAVLGIGAIVSPPLAIALVLMLVVSGVVMATSAATLARLQSARLVHLRTRLGTVFVETVQGLTDVLALHLQDRSLQQWHELHMRWRETKIRLHRISGFFTGLSLAISLGTMWIVLQLAIRSVNQHHLAGVLLPVIVLLTLASFEIVNGLPAAFQQEGELRLAHDRVAQLVDRPLPSPMPRQEMPPHPTVQLDHIGVRLGDPAETVLDDITVTLEPASHVALVGPNGSGKSTLLSVLTRLTEYQTGTFFLGGRDVRTLDPDQVRSHFSVVNQHPDIFDTTLRENLLLARPGASAQDVAKAVAISGLEELLASLPAGWDTPLGERGNALSGGEVKRLAIARAVLKGAPIVLLDEPTEGLDPLSERRLLTQLLQWARHRTVLWATHRMSQAMLMEKVIVLADRQLVDYGPSRHVLSSALVQHLFRYQVLG